MIAASQFERVRNLLESEILARQIKPGERLDEITLSERFKTSSEPLRGLVASVWRQRPRYDVAALHGSALQAKTCSPSWLS